MWRWIQNAIGAFFEILSASKKEDTRENIAKESRLPEVLFDDLIIVDRTPSNNLIGTKQFIEVVYNDVPRWAIFKCPCTCGNVISLPLQASHSPRWKVTQSQAGRPTLYPSVWQNKGCMSHFWIEEGRVFWCNDSGIAPSVARPDLYSRRKH